MSDYIGLLFLAGALGTDATSMAIGLGLKGVSLKEISITSLIVGIFHIIMPLAGIYIGRYFGQISKDLASLLGALALIIIGVNMIREAYGKKENFCKQKAINKAWSLPLAALCVSIDSFSVGFGLGAMTALSIPITVITIGATAAIMTAAGFFLGYKMKSFVGNKAEIAGGIILILTGIILFIF